MKEKTVEKYFTKPYLKKLLNDKVESLLKEYNGGEKFFDELDDTIRDKKFFNYLYNKIVYLKSAKYTKPFIVVGSGKFAKLFFNYFFDDLHKEKISFISFNGSLRNFDNLPEVEIYDLDDELAAFACNMKVGIVFIDDTIYAGTTRIRCVDYLRFKFLPEYIPKNLKVVKDSHMTTITTEKSMPKIYLWKTFVIYDGSRHLKDISDSIYRYWDYFKMEVKRIKERR